MYSAMRAYHNSSAACVIVEMILDASNTHTDVFNIDCSVEELIQLVSTMWSQLIPDGAILSISYNGRRGS